MTTTLSGHIEVDDNGVARITGSRIKVIHLVMEQRANGWSAEETQQNFSAPFARSRLRGIDLLPRPSAGVRRPDQGEPSACRREPRGDT
jgi:hypothetical protein